MEKNSDLMEKYSNTKKKLDEPKLWNILRHNS